MPLGGDRKWQEHPGAADHFRRGPGGRPKTPLPREQNVRANKMCSEDGRGKSLQKSQGSRWFQREVGVGCPRLPKNHIHSHWDEPHHPGPPCGSWRLNIGYLTCYLMLFLLYNKNAYSRILAIGFIALSTPNISVCGADL